MSAPSIDSIELTFTDGTERHLHWEADYDDEGDDLPTGTWMCETFDERGDSTDYGPAEEWVLKAAGLWRAPHVAEPLSSANWDGD